MKLNTVGISAVALIIYFSLYNTVGCGITIGILAIIFFIQATLFSIKPKCYDKFLNFVNQHGIRKKDVIERSVPRLKNYLKMDTQKIDVSDISAKETAEIIYKSIINEE